MQKSSTNRRAMPVLANSTRRSLCGLLTSSIVTAVSCALLFGGAAPSIADDVGGEPIVIPPSASPPPVPVAPEPVPKASDWQFDVGVYGWFIFINGSMTFQDQTSDVELGFDDIWKKLHMAFMAEADVRWRDVGFFGDLTYAYLWNRDDTDNLNLRTNTHLTLFDFGLYYELFKFDLGARPSAPRLRLQPYLGGRYFFVGIDSHIRGHRGFIDEFIGKNEHSIAPVLGLRGFLDIDDHWNVRFQGDGGGWGVDEMDLTWLAELHGGYLFHFSRFDFNLMVGYKAVGVEVSGKSVQSDLIFHGPVLRVAFEF